MERVFSMDHRYQLTMLVQNMTQVKPRSPAITQRLLEHDLTRLNGLTIVQWGSEIRNSLDFKWSKMDGLQLVQILKGI